MRPPICVLLSVLVMIADGFSVRGPSGPLVAPLGSSVVLPCYVDKPLPMVGLEVEWKRTDSETLVHLYQDGKSRPEAHDYHDRAHFFTDQIQHGNFSLRLDNLRAEDQGEYTCKVYTDQESGETLLALKVDNIERLVVSGSDEAISASVGEDVTLHCSIDSHITPEHIEEVSWKKIEDGDLSLVLLYQNNKAFPDSSSEHYRDRVEFFTDEIPKGNFSLRLKSVRTEDKGVYMCQVFAEGLSANVTAEIARLGFSVSHKIVLIACISASGSALLLCCLIYCRSPKKDSVFRLQMFLVFCPNILMFLAFVFWGVSEGSLFESVSCCALYFLRPLMLLWSSPYINKFTGNVKYFIQHFSYDTEYIVFSAVFYSVLFKYAWDKSLNYTLFEGVVIIVVFLMVLLFNSIYIIYLLITIIGKVSERLNNILDVLAAVSFNVLPSLQFILLFFACGSRGGFFIIAVLPVFLSVSNYDWDFTCGERMGCSPPVRRSVWMFLTLLFIAVMVCFYFIALKIEKDRMGWVCMIAFLQLFWAVIDFTRSFDSDTLPRVVPVYLFGSVAVVLLNSVSLMTELILKTVNGYGAVGDLRVVVFSSEFIFTLFLMILLVFEPWVKPFLQSCQKSIRSRGTEAAGSQNQKTPNTAELHELNPLLNKQD